MILNTFWWWWCTLNWGPRWRIFQWVTTSEGRVCWVPDWPTANSVQCRRYNYYDCAVWRRPIIFMEERCYLLIEVDLDDNKIDLFGLDVEWPISTRSEDLEVVVDHNGFPLREGSIWVPRRRLVVPDQLLFRIQHLRGSEWYLDSVLLLLVGDEGAIQEERFIGLDATVGWLK